MPAPLIYALAFFLVAAGVALVIGMVAFVIGWRQANRNIARMQREHSRPLNPRARDRG